jgi:hypothetical protein
LRNTRLFVQYVKLTALNRLELRHLNAHLDEVLLFHGRERDSVRRSLITDLFFGQTHKELQALLDSRAQTGAGLRKRGFLVKVGEQIREQLAELEKIRLQRVMFQWLDLDDLKGLEALAKIVLWEKKQIILELSADPGQQFSCRQIHHAHPANARPGGHHPGVLRHHFTDDGSVLPIFVCAHSS